jgi:hypothetical protein
VQKLMDVQVVYWQPGMKWVQLGRHWERELTRLFHWPWDDVEMKVVLGR